MVLADIANIVPPKQFLWIDWGTTDTMEGNRWKPCIRWRWLTGSFAGWNPIHPTGVGEGFAMVQDCTIAHSPPHGRGEHSGVTARSSLALADRFHSSTHRLNT